MLRPWYNARGRGPKANHFAAPALSKFPPNARSALALPERSPCSHRQSTRTLSETPLESHSPCVGPRQSPPRCGPASWRPKPENAGCAPCTSNKVPGADMPSDRAHRLLLLHGSTPPQLSNGLYASKCVKACEPYGLNPGPASAVGLLQQAHPRGGKRPPSCEHKSGLRQDFWGRVSVLGEALREFQASKAAACRWSKNPRDANPWQLLQTKLP